MTAEEILAAQNEAAAAQQPAPPAEVVPMEMTVQVSYRMGDGTVLAGDFVHAVATVADRISIGRVAATQRGGFPAEVFPADVRDLIDATSYIAVTYKRRPAWADKISATAAPGLVLKLWEEGLRHDARFWDACCDLRPSSPAI